MGTVITNATTSNGIKISAFLEKVLGKGVNTFPMPLQYIKAILSITQTALCIPTPAA